MALLFGRGTSDMKAFIAIGLAKVPDLVSREAVHTDPFCLVL